MRYVPKVSKLKFQYSIIIIRKLKSVFHLPSWDLNENIKGSSFNLAFRWIWSIIEQTEQNQIAPIITLLDLSSQLGMEWHRTWPESYLQILGLFHYEQSEFNWWAVCEIVPDSPVFGVLQRFPKCSDWVCQMAWLEFHHVHKDHFWWKLKRLIIQFRALKIYKRQVKNIIEKEQTLHWTQMEE